MKNDERKGEFIWNVKNNIILLLYHIIVIWQATNKFCCQTWKKNTTSYIISLKKIIINKNLDWFHLIYSILIYFQNFKVLIKYLIQ